MMLYLKEELPRWVLEKGPTTLDIRIKSREATSSDCSSFLRPGIDISVLSTSQSTPSNSPQPVRIDGRINSIKRNRHDPNCSCQFYVNFYLNQGSFGTQRTLSKQVKVISLNQISILQRIDQNSISKDNSSSSRWDSSMDCSSVPQTKLLLGKFLSDISWLVIASFIKKAKFDVRSVDNKIVYQVLGGNNNVANDSQIDVVNFEVDGDGNVQSMVSQIDTHAAKKIGYNKQCDDGYSPEDEKAEPCCNNEGLRRSKRRHVQPDRYLGCEAPVIDVSAPRTWPYKMSASKEEGKKEEEEEEEPIPLACNKPCFQVKWTKEDVVSKKKIMEWKKLGDADQDGIQTPVLVFPPAKKDEPLPLPKNLYNLNDKDNMQETGKEGKVEEFSARIRSGYGAAKLHMKNSVDLDDVDIELGLEWTNSKRRVQEKRKHHSSSRTYSNSIMNLDDEERSYKDRTLNAASYKEIIDSYLRKIEKVPTVEKEQPSIMDQWIATTRECNEQKNEMGKSHVEEEEEEEISETDRLWREMEMSMASSYLVEEETKDSDAVAFAETTENCKEVCQHENRLDDEIGIYCIRCGVVSVDIKCVATEFLPQNERTWHWQDEKRRSSDSEKPEGDEDAGDHKFFATSNASRDEPMQEENGNNVWELVPDLKAKMHVHQRKAFEFLWQNIAGSVEPSEMVQRSKAIGGCVISHSPGAGKTLLVIAFLLSYLKLFPGKRPLILAPKTTLYTWYKEFIKWEIPLPVYLIHGRSSQKEFKEDTVIIPGLPKSTNDVKHVVDCLQKIHKWHEHPSVLIMGYTSFLSLMREDSKFSHRKYMAKVLRESPGILVLDEGHNPRSTKSNLRKVLMKVKTELRVLLSGTLFQNNFCEYFNTLCLARPRFVHEVLSELDGKYRSNREIAEKARHLLEARARKFFLDQIAKRINSNEGDDTVQGLNLLKELTNGFIDVYDGGNSETLPGLQIYTLVMNTADIQYKILLELHKKMGERNGYPLELELLITLGSIHPWLVKTAACAAKFLSVEQLRELDEVRSDLKKGSKVRFVLSLVSRVFLKEKVLIFCHNIAPVKLLVEMFERVFHWRRDREILVLNGELELFQRGKVIDEFEDPSSVSRVLLASITACGEGISLTAASRVIMLDSEWNPSKTKQAIARAFRPGQQKMVYVYQLLSSDSLEVDKHRRNKWKEWVSCMIFNEESVEGPSHNIEDDVLRDMVEEDRYKSFHMIMKNDKYSATI
ncbi:SNF2 domain-containing protein CLASSY [Stylosanthes scabra]|uniref:SNF2 domain-containing protein CLASSY n=1 Tax=Stylosanthes scabra TaxID=79078 RepID=A0ABU6SI32_9FABA|nr:SNF2 domain-containing protein CLASSY [Stylosanthes scabra]